MEDGEVQSKGSEREANENLVHPDIIKNLRVGQCILLRHSPSRIDLINIRNRKMEIFEPNESTKMSTPTTKISQSRDILKRGQS